jgi:single-strand DNA-binding protein
MSEINRVFLSGRLARDPEIKYTSSGIAFCTFDLATSRAVKQGDGWTEEAMFFNRLTVWRKQAEVFHKYLRQGDGVFIEGNLTINEWETQEGQKRRDIRIQVDNFRFGAKRGSGGRSSSADTGGEGEPSPPRTPSQDFDEDQGGVDNINDQEIPF